MARKKKKKMSDNTGVGEDVELKRSYVVGTVKRCSFSGEHCLENSFLKTPNTELPGGPVVRTLHSHWLNPWVGNSPWRGRGVGGASVLNK